MKIIIDLDHTITLPGWEGDYDAAPVNIAVLGKLRRYREKGYKVCIYTSRNMRSFEGNIGLINVKTLPQILSWLDKNDVPYDEVVVGKPWCGHEGFYVDDRAIRPKEFVELGEEEIRAVLAENSQ
ncbi:capsular biosynthesis protein [Kordiimonas sp.]|uniref:capsular biosynthesis protein n=1 Tax=Kordiimonas sp. TaxID=1970157 RepID=UPI003A8E0EA3